MIFTGTYGYDQALSRDPASLSYVYELDEKNWLLMLDSSQYEPKNLVEGRIKEETLQWARQQLESSQGAGRFLSFPSPITTFCPRAACTQPSA